jgi:pSer/pThr/pTyr-binding forkhead associated (FHA) protein
LRPNNSTLADEAFMKEHKFTIGRSRKCDIVLADDTVSRHHAELIFLHNGHLLLIDCHSQNKTSIVENGQVRRISQEFIASSWSGDTERADTKSQ